MHFERFRALDLEKEVGKKVNKARQVEEKKTELLRILASAKKSLEAAVDHLAEVKATHAEIQQVVIPTGIFDAAAGRRLEGPAPARPLALLSWEASLEALSLVLQNLRSICFEEEMESLEETKRYFWKHSRANLDIVSRSRLWVTGTSLLIVSASRFPFDMFFGADCL